MSSFLTTAELSAATGAETPAAGDSTETLLARLLNAVLATSAHAATLAGAVPRKLLLCIVQPNAAGTWELLDDSTHAPFGGTPVITQTGSAIVVTYPSAFTKIYGAFAVCDESLAKGGFTTGPSVGLSSMSIQLNRALPTGGLVAWTSGTTFAFSSGGGDCTLSWGSGELTITSPHPIGGSIGLGRWDTGYEPRVSSAPNGSTQFKLKFYDAAGVQVTTPDANCKCTFIAGMDAANDIWINPTGVTSTKYPSSNIWVAVWGI